MFDIQRIVLSYMQIYKSRYYQVRLFCKSWLAVGTHVRISNSRRKNYITPILNLRYRSAFIVNHYFLSFSEISTPALRSSSRL
jgi:hypothetical protein